MGEAPAFFVDDLQKVFSNGFDPKPKVSETETILGDKTYVIGEAHEGLPLSIRILDKSTSEWVIPTVLGTKPQAGNGHSAELVNEDRILIIKRGSTPDDCIWFLEVDTEFVREQRKILGIEVVAWSRGVIGDAKKPIVISGPSGVGKGTLISKLMKEFPSMFGFSVSHTTRAPRDKEINGVHYHFTERSVMEKEIKDEKFLEFANVHGNLYGTSIEAVEVVADAGKRCILDIDVQGARSVRTSSLEAVFIFICPPSFEELEKRLRSRGTETEEQIQKRLRNAKAELEQGQSPGLFDHLLVNDDLDKCYENLKKLLDLEDVADTFSKPSSNPAELPLGHLVSKIHDKVLIRCRTLELEKASKNLMVLDVSSLKGGAPGRTRALKFKAIESFPELMNGINHLS